MTAGERLHLTYRERQLLDAYRKSDERGQVLIDSVAADQSRNSCFPVRATASAPCPLVGELHDISSGLSRGEKHELIGYAKALEMNSAATKPKPLLRRVK